MVLEDHQPEYVRLRANTPAEGYLVLADSYYPGWRAWLDGQPVRILRADIALRAVALPPGQHVVEFRFEPMSWRLGTIVSVVAWTSLAALGIAYLALMVGRRE